MASIPSASPDAGFELIERTDLRGPGVVLETYRHRPSGARHLHLASEDPVNACMLGVHTPPVDDSGLTHVLEHMVLCGGRRFPARRAFFSMLWRSACLTMNANASGDCTGYHFATRHPRDFHNLLQVYLDCLFNPRLDEEDFDQEARRVVYSEMQGVMSEPRACLQAAVDRHLFAGSAYRFNAGGDPDQLAHLTLAQVRSYHRRVYHPARALFMTSGNMPAACHHPFIQSIAFDAVPGAPALAPDAVLDPPALPAPQAISQTVSAAGGDREAHAQIAVAWLLGARHEPRDLLEARLLAALLLEHSDSPLRRVLESARFKGGPSAICGLDESRRRLSLCVAIERADPGEASAVEQALLDALSTWVDGGIAGAEVTAALDRMELGLRMPGSRRYPHGLDLLARMLTPALHGGDPRAHLDLTTALQGLREDAACAGYLGSRVAAALLDNPNRLRLSLVPAAAAKPPAPAPATRSSDDHAQHLDSVDGLPDLDPSQLLAFDLCAETPAQHYPGLRLHPHAVACSGLVHQQLAIALPILPPSLLRVLPLLLPCLGHLAQGAFAAPETARRIARAGGGLRAEVRIGCDWHQLARARVVLMLSATTLARHQDDMAVLMQQALDEIRFDDPVLLGAVLERARARIHGSALAQGHLSARYTAAAGFGVAAALTEQCLGLPALRELSAVLDAVDREQALAGLAERLQGLVQQLATCPREARIIADPGRCPEAVRVASARWSAPQGAPPRWSAPRGAPSTQWCDADLCAGEPPGDRLLDVDLPVGHAARVLPAVAPGHQDAPALAVMGALVTAEILHQRVREQGGAYGAGAGYCRDTGTFHFFSYRDPRPLNTLSCFDEAVQWLSELSSRPNIERAISHAKLGAIRELERSESAAQAAMRSFEDLLLDRRAQTRKDFHAAVLAVDTSACARAFNAHLRDAAAASVVMTNASTAAAPLPPGMRVQRL